LTGAKNYVSTERQQARIRAETSTHKTGRTKAINMRGAPMRGGYRL